jgi:hypothetical protein
MTYTATYGFNFQLGSWHMWDYIKCQTTLYISYVYYIEMDETT